MRPHLDYVGITYDQTHNASPHQKLEYIQYNSALAITSAIREQSTERLQTLKKDGTEISVLS